MCNPALLLLLTALLLTGGCKAFRAAFDEAPEETATRRRHTNDWFVPRKKPELMLHNELNATERAEIERIRAIDVEDRSEEIERERQERKDWVFGR